MTDITVNFIGELFLSIRFVLCAICAGFNRLRWVFFSEFAGRRSYFDPYLSTVVVDDEGVRKPVAGHARRGEESTGWDVSVKRPGYGARDLPGSECKNPLNSVSTWRKVQKSGGPKAGAGL